MVGAAFPSSSAPALRGSLGLGVPQRALSRFYVDDAAIRLSMMAQCAALVFPSTLPRGFTAAGGRTRMAKWASPRSRASRTIPALREIAGEAARYFDPRVAAQVSEANGSRDRALTRGFARGSWRRATRAQRKYMDVDRMANDYWHSSPAAPRANEHERRGALLARSGSEALPALVGRASRGHSAGYTLQLVRARMQVLLPEPSVASSTNRRVEPARSARRPSPHNAASNLVTAAKRTGAGRARWAARLAAAAPLHSLAAPAAPSSLRASIASPNYFLAFSPYDGPTGRRPCNDLSWIRYPRGASGTARAAR
jgi:hypothetical protein